MAGWNNGRLAGWQDGRMAEWNGPSRPPYNWLLWRSHLQAKITDYKAIPVMYIDQVNCVAKQSFSYNPQRAGGLHGSPWLLYTTVMRRQGGAIFTDL